MSEEYSGKFTLNLFGLECKCEIPKTGENDMRMAEFVSALKEEERVNNLGLEKMYEITRKHGLGEEVGRGYMKSLEKRKWRAIGDLALAAGTCALLNNYDFNSMAENIGYFGVAANGVVGLYNGARVFLAEKEIMKNFGGEGK